MRYPALVLATSWALALCASSAIAAPLNGIYTCANGNPGNAFDYADLGDFFDDLEDDGVSGPVTLNVFDDGGPFISNLSYLVGLEPVWGIPQPITGLSFANRLIVQAAPGEHPEVTGAGIVFPLAQPPEPVTLYFWEVSFVTLEGLTFRNGADDCIWFQGSAQTCSYIRVAGCRIYGIPDRLGIVIADDGAPVGPSFMVLENNMIWDCKYGGVLALNPGIEWIVRHNTIVEANATTGWVGVHINQGEPFEQFCGNLIRVTSNTAPAFYSHCLYGSSGPAYAGPFAISADHNTYWFEGTTAGLYTPSLSPTWTFAQWQAAGFDLHGQVADPKLVNINPGFEDLHLRHDSPCINFVTLATTNEDIDGDTRPVGGARDAGADEFVPPEMRVEFLGAPVAHGGAFNLGVIPANGAARVFTIRNLGPGPLRLIGNPLVVLTLGANCHAATAVQVMPALTLLAPNTSTDFTLFIRPLAVGLLDLGVEIACNDPARTPYSFTLNGTGVPPNGPARANAPAGSNFAGPLNGPFQYPVQPGAVLANANIELTDPDADLITVLSITPLTALPTGITPPAIGAPAHPRMLTWTGVADAANPPGNYRWQVQFRDAVLQTVVSIQVTIQILNLAPVHAIGGALGGDGSQGNPYQCGFNRGDDGLASAGLCTVSDPNTSQTPFIGASIRAPANPGAVGFSFTLNAGVLSVSPVAMLTVAEAGQHDYEVQVTDAINPVSIFVAITVANAPLNFTTPQQLPTGETGTAYTRTLAVTGAIGAVTFALTAGTLPDALTLNAATGEISGMATAAATGNFTIEAQDSTGATASRAFQLAINDPAVAPPHPGPGESGNGCVAAASCGTILWPALLAFAALRRRRSAGQRLAGAAVQARICGHATGLHAS